MSKSALEILEVITLIIIAICALVGNCMIILAFIIGPKPLKTFTNYFVVNLAVADLMVGSLSLPFWIVNRFDSTLVNEEVYKYFIALDILCGTTSILNLTAISLERMFAVKYPTRHFNLSPLPVIIAIAATWSIGFTLTGAKFAVTSKNSMRCYTASIFVLAFVVPLIIIVASYWVIFYCAVSMMKDSSNQDGRIKRELRVAKTISVIIGLFLFCWSPFFIVNMTFIFCEGDLCTRLPYWLISVTKIMHYSNSMMNFFVYGHRSPDFRRSFHAFFKCNLSILQERVRSFSESIGRTRAASFRRHRESQTENCYSDEKSFRKFSISTKLISK